MVSEPNFIIGIKQTSLHSKQDSHTHNTDPQQCPCLLSNLGPQHHATPTEALLLPRHQVFDLSSKPCNLPFRFVHNKPLLDETNKTELLHNILRPKPRNSETNDHHMHIHALIKPPVTPPARRQNSRILDWIMVHTPLCRPRSPPIYKT